MLNLKDLKLSVLQENVFSYFEEISSVPHGSGNMKAIADYCENFAQKHSLKYKRDRADNVVIFKNGQNGGENAQPIILQGHIDMVCQSTAECEIDFLKDGLELLRQGDFIKANGTTLGGDNGIAVAYIFTILSDRNIPHPPIEAVLTTDEEIGLLGANALDTSILKAKKMINLDSENDSVLTVSCAGGQDVILKIRHNTTKQNGTKLTLEIKGLLGGHSGVEIDKGRTNANVLMGKILEYLNQNCNFDVISVNGGKKPNAIPDSCTAEICVEDKEKFLLWFQNVETEILSKTKEIEPDFFWNLEKHQNGEYNCFDKSAKANILHLFKRAPDGVIKMSEEIDGLVETSLNLGILSTESGIVTFHYALRSNKTEKLLKLSEQILDIGKKADAHSTTSGFYPPWEYNPSSPLRELYKNCYKELFKTEIIVNAIHAGLECAVFSSTVKDLDCISVGPTMYDVHTPNERLSISSTAKTFELLLKVLSKSCNL